MLEQGFLEVAGVPGFARDGEPLARAAAHVDVAVCIHAADVAGVEPAVADHLGGLLRAAPVAEHVAAGDGDLAGLSDGGFAAAHGVDYADLAIGQRRAAGEELLVPRRGERPQADEAAELALAEALRERELELVAPRLLQRRRRRTAAGDAEAQRARRPAALAAFVEQLGEVGR